jgi:Histidine phosphatase superfamily (branch 1)
MRRAPIDPAIELKGPALLAALRKGGYVLYLRHTETGTVTEQCTQSNLSPNGEEQARRLGASLRALKIPFGLVLSSDICRILDTARLLDLGPVVPTEDLRNRPKRPGHDFHSARGKRIGEMPAKGTNTLLVAHMQGGDRPEQSIFLEMGEIVVFQPDGKGGAAIVARVRMNEWDAVGTPVAATAVGGRQ